MNRKKVFAAIAACAFLTGCGNETVNEVLGYLKKPEATASASAEPAEASQAAVIAAPAQQPSSDASIEANPFPWTRDANGQYPNGIIGTITVLKDGMEIHQYGGVASQTVGTAKANDEYLVSSEFMDSSGNKWYCVGSEMWLRVTNMSDIDYRNIEYSKTPDPNLQTYTNDTTGVTDGTDGGDSAPLTDETQSETSDNTGTNENTSADSNDTNLKAQEQNG